MEPKDPKPKSADDAKDWEEIKENIKMLLMNKILQKLIKIYEMIQNYLR
jgi:hypothetical protein